MSVIGSFTAKDNKYRGAIASLTIRANDLRIVPVRQPTEGGPSHRVYAGRIEIGAAWSKRSRDGKAYLSLKLDDPSLMAPVYASLLASEAARFTN
ncbi:DUF736 domain-containing protein [Lichenifustis flavocetrariae]|uniref:DUF736 domain-containing protein n=1 Tax=Lichenifustis flavocetrariae TaxID=2949735 RepID=A0AA41YQR9_9HYPH|nr:DUF736 domain-containing protein [Lichenifustis flavocetrariae]MCW6506414.1 DUF736 domain-containing protein [Lichenifustis flavocetrariae]